MKNTRRLLVRLAATVVATIVGLWSPLSPRTALGGDPFDSDRFGPPKIPTIPGIDRDHFGPPKIPTIVPPPTPIPRLDRLHTLWDDYPAWSSGATLSP